MQYGQWYRSLYASSDPYSGYASWMLPGLLYEAENKNTKDLDKIKAQYTEALHLLNDRIQRLQRSLK